MKSSEPGIIWLIYLVHLPAHTKSKRLQAEQVTCSRLQDSGQSGSALPHFSFVCTDREPDTGYWRLVAGTLKRTYPQACLVKPGIGLKTVKVRYEYSKCFFFSFLFSFFLFYIWTLSWLQKCHDHARSIALSGTIDLHEGLRSTPR